MERCVNLRYVKGVIVIYSGGAMDACLTSSFLLFSIRDVIFYGILVHCLD